MTSPDELARMPSLLIVEDEFLIANDLRRILIKAGYRVTGMAGSVAQAQALVQEQKPDIVLLDIFLIGHQTGIDLAYWLNEHAIPFVFLSANLTDGLLEGAKVTQPFGFLTKPFREKDVLTTLEIARYRHAHSAEAKLRQQQTIQIAVNNAIVSIQNREQLCLAIADQINRLVPFSFLNLRIGLPDQASFYWLMLEKTGTETFERVNLSTMLRGKSDEQLIEKLDREAPDRLGDQTGVFTGESFEQLSSTYVTARLFRNHFGIRSLALFPVPLKHHSLTTLILSSTEPNGFTPKDYEAVSLITPQIALALDNLLAYEELEARRQTKAVELAIANAFQHSSNLPTILSNVAQSINELFPMDLMVLYRPGQPTETDSGSTVLEKIEGQFVDRPADQLPPDWQEVLVDLQPWLIKPTLRVGCPFIPHKASGRASELYRRTRGLQSVLSIPIFTKDHSGTALLLASRAPYAFTYKDLSTLQDLGVQLALALENLLAFEQIKTLSEQLEREKTYLIEEIKTSHNVEEMIGASAAMQTVFTRIGQVARTDATVLIMGETGTGKELVARAVHNLSTRKARTLVKVNCAALPAQLIESELFGHERGSFTGALEKRIGKFELADGGTLFLDEIGELPLELQAKLLRAIQDREIERIGGRSPIRIDTRIVVATNRNLPEEVASGRFRPDLYYRLNVFPIVVPPLRERPDDIRPLALHFLRRIGKKLGKTLTSITHASLQQLLSYAWPGNIRELEHVLERAAILSETPTLELAEPLRSLTLPGTFSGISPSTKPILPIDETMRSAILAALTESGNRIRGAGGAAELLNLKPTTLEARMKKLNINPSARPGRV